MPKYVSDEGNWKPAKERVAPKDKDGVDFIYEGDDRAALEEMKLGNVTSRKFYEDPEMIARVRQIHNCSMAEYMTMMGYDEKVSKETFEKNIAEVNTYQPPKRKPQQRQRSGGQNTAGESGHYEGGLGDKPKV